MDSPPAGVYDGSMRAPDLPARPSRICRTIEEENDLRDLDLHEIRNVPSSKMIWTTRPLCGACHNTFLRFIQEVKNDRRRVENMEPKYRAFQAPAAHALHHVDSDSLAASARSGCRLCHQLQLQLFALFPNGHKLFGLLMRWEWRTDYLSFTYLTNRSGSDQAYFFLHMSGNQLQSFPSHGSLDWGTATDVPMSQELARYWYDSCICNSEGRHERCEHYRGGQLPTRLLDIERARKEGSLHLTIFGGLQAGTRPDHHYATLSYCWGLVAKDKLPLLKSTNLRKMQDTGLRLVQLPKTFRDAIEIAGWFRIKWLWVDCLCILQDDCTDWEKEAESMSRIYRNAELNISADWSPDAFGGCFTPQDSKLAGIWQVSLPEFRDVANLGSHKSEEDWKRECPSLSRAWICRERQLSRRILHFTADELVWECCGVNFASQTFPFGTKIPFGQEIKYQGTLTDSNAVGEWERLCESFSNKRLTHFSDLPMVMSSLLDDFSDFLPAEDNLAGLWRSSLPQSLLWRHVEPQPANTVEARSPGSSTLVGFSSWSPFSASAPFILRGFGDYFGMPLLRIVSTDLVAGKKWHDPRRIKALTVFGLVRRIRLHQAQAREHDMRQGRLLTLDDGVGPLFGTLTSSRKSPYKLSGYLCLDREPSAQDEIYLFLVVAGEGIRKVEGLLLKPVHSGGVPCFRRAGYVEFTDDDASRIVFRTKPGFPVDGGFPPGDGYQYPVPVAHECDSGYKYDPANVDPMQLYGENSDAENPLLQRLTPQKLVIV